MGFTKAICESELAQRLLRRGVDISPDWANGAKILVEGLTAAMFDEGGFAPSDLRQWHVVMWPSQEKEVHDVLKALSYRTRPREKTRHTISLQPNKVAHGEQTNACSVDAELEERASRGHEQEEVPGEDIWPKLPEELRYSRTFIDLRQDPRIGLSPRSNYTKSSNDRLGISNPRQWG